MTKTLIMDLAPGATVHQVLAAEHFGPVEPLDRQFGQMHKRCVPEALADVVFRPGLNTFAVIDSAAVPSATGIAQDAGLQMACLFKGDLGEALEEVAPWIFELTPDSRLTRLIFTKGPAEWDLWRKPTVLLIQTDASLDDMRAHLRKFTRAQDSKGNWLFFRFWELPVLRYLRKGAMHDGLTARLLDRHRFLFPDRGPEGDDGLWVLHMQDAD